MSTNFTAVLYTVQMWPIKKFPAKFIKQQYEKEMMAEGDMIDRGHENETEGLEDR